MATGVYGSVGEKSCYNKNVPYRASCGCKIIRLFYQCGDGCCHGAERGDGACQSDDVT